MAAVLVLSTMSFSVHKHFCGAFLVETSFIVPTHGCDMDMNVNTQLPQFSCELAAVKSCCNDVHELIQGQDTLKQDLYSVSIDSVFIAPLVTQVHVLEDAVVTTTTSSFIPHKPPLPQRQLFLLHDSFLI